MYDYWIVKIDSNGAIQWEKCYGGFANEYAQSIRQTFDGGYIIAGSSDTPDSSYFGSNGDVTGNHGCYDWWIVKLNDTGAIQWEECIGGTLCDYSYDIEQTNDSGYIVAGTGNFYG